MGRVHDIGDVEVKKLDEQRIALTLAINGKETTIYNYKSDLEIFAWVKNNFIPVYVLVNNYLY